MSASTSRRDPVVGRERRIDGVRRAAGVVELEELLRAVRDAVRRDRRDADEDLAGRRRLDAIAGLLERFDARDEAPAATLAGGRSNGRARSSI